MKSGLRSKGLVTILLAMMFAAGAAVGVAGDRMVAAEDTAETDAEMHKGRFAIEQHADELGLTASQREQIKPILDIVMVEALEIADECRPRLVALGEAAQVKVKEYLTPEQVERYDAILTEREKADRKRREAIANSVPAGLDSED
ncbi:MAG: hypothetical protein ABFS14_12945 [Gemmatimonadota bacterium]